MLGFSEVGKAYRRNLLAMGLTPGVEITLNCVAPTMGDPLEIPVLGLALSLRKDETDALQTEKNYTLALVGNRQRR